MLELLKMQTHLAPQHPQMPPPTLKTEITVIMPTSLTIEPDARLKGTEKVMDHLEEELEEELLLKSKLNQIHQCS